MLFTVSSSLSCTDKLIIPRAASLHIMAATFGIAALGFGPTARGQQVPEPASDPIVQEFLDHAVRLESGFDPLLGRAQILDIERRLALTDSEAYPARAAALLAQLGYEYLRVGDLDEAAKRVDDLFALSEEHEQPPTPLMYRLKILLELRRAAAAEGKHRNQDSGLFPIAGEGIHRDKGSARRILESLQAILKDHPNHLDAQWLLNIAAMAAGEFPERVPEIFRLLPESLRSDIELDRFPNIAPELGLDASDLAGGVVMEDFDGDGFLDIITSTSDPREALHLYRNGGDGTFAEISEAAGLQNQLGGLNCLGADYDNDGDVDLLVLRGAWLGRSGRIRNSLLRNDGAAGPVPVTFTDVTQEAGLAEPAYPTQTAVWADFNQDGHLDLFVGNESAVAQDAAARAFPSQLFQNNGDGTFQDITRAAGLRNDRLAKGVTVGDYDNDGDLDLYLSNIGANRLYRNDTPAGPDQAITFTDVAADLGVTGPEPNSSAPFFFDFNNDGWLDLFVPAYDATTGDLALAYRKRNHSATPPALYLNKEGRFENIAEQANLNHPFLPLGASFGDIDNDGWLDIHLVTGDPNFETLMPNVMLRNEDGERFQNVTTSTGLGAIAKGHGSAFADLDHDGDQDLFQQMGGFFPGDKSPNALFLNPGSGNHWLSLELRGTQANRDAIGARIVVNVKTPRGSRSIHRAVGSTSSSDGSPFGREHIGLGDATGIESLSITWPGDAKPVVFSDVTLDTAIRAVQGREELEKLERKRLVLHR